MNNPWSAARRQCTRPTQEFQVFRLTSDLHGTTRTGPGHGVPGRTSSDSGPRSYIRNSLNARYPTDPRPQALTSSFLIPDTARRKSANYDQLLRYEPPRGLPAARIRSKRLEAFP